MSAGTTTGCGKKWPSRRPPAAERPKPERERPQAKSSRKLSYKEQRELEELPRRIETLEAEQTQLHQRMAEPAFFRQGGAEIAKVTARLESLETELRTAYERWETLEQRTSD